MRQIRTTRQPARLSLSGQRIDHAVIRFRRARAYQSVPDWTVRGFCAGVALDALVVAFGRFFELSNGQGIGYPQGVVGLLVLPFLFAAVAGLCSAVWRVPLEKVAREVDARLGLAARVATALEIEQKRAAAAEGADSLSSVQHADALGHLRRYEPHEAFPLRLSRREGLSFVVAFAFLLVLAFLPAVNSRDGGSTDRTEIARVEAERLSALADELAANADLSEEEKQQLAETLSQVAQQLQAEAASPEHAMAALSQVERSLAAQESATAMDRELALARLADALDQTGEPSGRGREVARLLDRRDFDGAASELQRLGEQAAQLAPEEQRALAGALQQAASTTSRLDPALSETLADAASTLGSEQGAAAMQRAADEVQRAGQEVTSQRARERALAALQDARRAIGRGEQSASAQAQGQRSEAGSTDGDGQRDESNGANDGMSSASADGQGGQGGALGGAQPGMGEGGEEQGDAGGSSAGTGTLRNRGASEHEDVRSRQVRVPSDEFEQPQILPGQSLAEGDNGEAVVDYRQVAPQYRERATEAMASRYVPPTLKDLVREYFSSLDGSR